MLHRPLALFSLFMFLIPWLSAPLTLRPPVAGAPDFDAIDRYVETEMRATHIPGIALAIVHGDEIVHLKGFGVADDANRPVTAQTPFVIGSLSKSFTALAVMQLVEAGQLDLDQPVQHYLPWFQVADPQASGQITLRHLLNQTSGLSRQACEESSVMAQGANALEQEVRGLAHTVLSAPPGTRFQYCNANYQILGLLVETASGDSFANYLQAHVFDPLDMAHSYTALPAAEAGGLALGHRLMLGLPVPAYDRPYAEGSLPSGGLMVSAEDMAHYLIAQLNAGRYLDRQVLSADGLNTLHLPPSRVSNTNYAMGWAVGNYAGQPTLQHNGAVPGFISDMWLLPNRDYGVVVFENAYGTLFSNRMLNLGLGVVSLLLGQAPPPPPPETQSWVVLSGLAVIVIWQVASVALGRKLIRGRRSRSGGWWLGLAGAAALDGGIVVVCLVAFPAMAQTALRVMLVYSPDMTLLLLLLATASAVWGLARTLLALRPPARP